MTRRSLSVFLCIAALATGRTSHGHAGVPISTDVLLNPGTSVAYETTFGLLAQDEAGHWRLTCEETKEPGLKLFHRWPDGEVGMAYTSGYLFSDDGGCNFTPATGVSAAARTLEVANVGDDRPAVLALLTELLDGQEPGTNLFLSSDRGRSFRQLSLPKPYNVLSMAVSDTVPPEIVVTGDLTNTPAAGGDPQRERWLVRSAVCLTEETCEASDWDAIQLSEANLVSGTTRVLAIVPEGLFLRNVTGQESRLFRSTDGGHTFRMVLPTATQALPNPVDFLSRVGDNDLWISAGLQQTFHSVDGGETWEHRPDMGDIRCLRSDGPSLHSCVVDLARNTVASVSSDGGRTWTPSLRYDQVKGIKQCSSDSDVGVACDDLWLLISLAFKGETPQPSPQPAPSPKSGCSSVELGFLSLVTLLVRRRTTR